MPTTVPLPGIDHIVVLMLENRSFDNVLGGLGPRYPQGTDFNGVPANWSNPDTHGKPVPAWMDGDHDHPYATDPDPGESFFAMDSFSSRSPGTLS